MPDAHLLLNYIETKMHLIAKSNTTRMIPDGYKIKEKKQNETNEGKKGKNV